MDNWTCVRLLHPGCNPKASKMTRLLYFLFTCICICISVCICISFVISRAILGMSQSFQDDSLACPLSCPTHPQMSLSCHVKRLPSPGLFSGKMSWPMKIIIINCGPERHNCFWLLIDLTFWFALIFSLGKDLKV